MTDDMRDLLQDLADGLHRLADCVERALEAAQDEDLYRSMPDDESEGL